MSLTEWVNGISEFIFISKKKPSRQYDKEKSFSEVYIGDWSVYPVESLRQSAAVHSHPQEGVAKQPNHSYLSVSDWVKVPVKHSRQLYGQTGKSILVWFYHRCLLVSLFLLREVAGRQRDPLFWELQRNIAQVSQPAMARFCELREQAIRQGSAGTFGICSYQQERSALQSLQGEGGEWEWEWGRLESREAWPEKEKKLENCLGNGQINLNTNRGGSTLHVKPIRCIKTLETDKWAYKVMIDLLCL